MTDCQHDDLLESEIRRDPKSQICRYASLPPKVCLGLDYRDPYIQTKLIRQATGEKSTSSADMNFTGLNFDGSLTIQWCVDDVDGRMFIFASNCESGLMVATFEVKNFGTSDVAMRKMKTITGTSIKVDKKTNCRYVLSPRDGSILAVNIKILDNMKPKRTKVSLQWLKVNDRNSKITVISEASCLINDCLNLSYGLAPTQFCNNSETLLVYLAQVDSQAIIQEPSSYPDMVVFKLDYKTQSLTFARKFQTSTPIRTFINMTHDRYSIVCPIGRSFKYLHFMYKCVVEDFQEQDVLISTKMSFKNFDLKPSQIKLFYPFLTEFFKNLTCQKVFASNGKYTKMNVVKNSERIISNSFTAVISKKDSKREHLASFKLTCCNFKDYRTCANCGTMESKKRKNEKGKRIADFKVCRHCKMLDLHKRWLDFPCNYCSVKCLKSHWIKHKLNHENGQFQKNDTPCIKIINV